MMSHRDEFEKRVLLWIREKQLIPEGSTVCVCFSGGADSTALLHILYALRQQLHIELSACHLNHGIRGEEADRDARFCKSVCDGLGIPLFAERIDVPNLQMNSGKSLEETARDARYAWIAMLGEKQGIDLFATAHQKNDLAETVLQRVIRGTTTDGLQGIPVRRGNVIRPLLCVNREEIECYLSECGIPFIHDSTNDDEQFNRNYIRKTVLPALEKVNPRVLDSLCRLASYASEDHEYFSGMRFPAYSDDLPDALLRRKICFDYNLLCGKTLCFEQCERVMRLFRSKETDVISLPGYVNVRYEAGSLVFSKQSGILPELPEGELRDGVTLLCGGILRITVSDRKLPASSGETEFIYNLSTDIPLRSEGICGMIRYRTRKSGDRLLRFGVNRDVRKLVSEQKIPAVLRNILPCFYDEGGLLCVPFVGIADRVFSRGDGENKWIRVELDEQRALKESECL